MFQTSIKGDIVSDWNANIIEEFRENDGKVGGMFEGDPMLILHTTGAKTGQERLNPLLYCKEGDRPFVFASKSGADTHPDWFRNTKANPEVTLEIGTGTAEATAVEILGSARDEIYARQSSDDARFAGYQAGTDRTIPVIELLTS